MPSKLSDISLAASYGSFSAVHMPVAVQHSCRRAGAASQHLVVVRVEGPGQEGDEDAGGNHHWRVHPCKSHDKRLQWRLLCGCLADQLRHAGDGAVPCEGGGLDLQR